MSPSSVKLIHYISEATSKGFGQGVSTIDTDETPVSAMQKQAAEFEKKRKKDGVEDFSPSTKNSQGSNLNNIDLDPTIMGSQFSSLDAEMLKGTLVPLKLSLGLGGVLGTIGRGVQDIISSPAAAKEQIRAQQTAVRSMTNVRNYYRNLGIREPSMHPKHDLLKTMGQALGILPKEETK